MITPEQRYYFIAALRAGVPKLWLEDAVQEIAIRVWQSGDSRKIVVHRAAIDAARHYGPRSRTGSARIVPFVIANDFDDDDSDDWSRLYATATTSPWNAVDWCLDRKAALREARLTPGQRYAMGRWDVSPVGGAEQAQRKLARRRLREYVA